MLPSLGQHLNLFMSTTDIWKLEIMKVCYDKSKHNLGDLQNLYNEKVQMFKKNSSEASENKQ